MKPIIFTLLLSLLYIYQGNGQSQLPLLSVDVSSVIVSPEHYIITKSQQPIVIDGKPNDTDWQSAEFSDLFIDIEGVKIPKYETKMKMLWDEDYLYVYAEMKEPHVWGNLKQRDTIIYFNNDFEVFISPSGTTRNYGEIEINALGTVWDLLLNRPYRDRGKANNHWNLDALETAIYIDGTLNDHSDVDTMWAVEMAIPMKALLELKNKPRILPLEGEQWRMNFSRVHWDFDIVNETYQRKRTETGKLQSEYNWVWSNQNVINMHEPEKWGVVQFTYHSSSEQVQFIEDEFMDVSQVAFALFRETKRGNLTALLDEEVGNIRRFHVKYSNGQDLEATFYKTNFGFEYKIPLGSSGEFFIINEMGILRKIE